MSNTKTNIKPFFSIVIPTLNEEKYLPLLLKDLSKQSFGIENFEVIHVDGGSEDKTLEKAQKFAKNYPAKNSLNIKSITIDVKNVATQRNAGAKLASGEWVLFMDADNRLDSYFLDGIKYNLAKTPECDCFTTWIKAFEESQRNEAIIKTINFSTELYNLVGKPTALGAFIGVKTKITKKIVFDESQKVYEDALYIKNASDHGYKYQIFRDPKFYYSLRRMKKEGTLMIAAKGALLSLHYLQGKDFTHHTFGYNMEGGNSYTQNTPSIIRDFPDFIKNASKKQLSQAKKLLNNLKELQV